MASRPRLFTALAASAAVVLSSPFVGDARAALFTAFPRQFGLIVGTGIGIAVALAVIVALVRGAARRVGGIVLAIGGAVLYARLVASGNANVDAVEHVHFIEYGLLAWLFYEAWRPADNGLAVAWPLIAGVLTGIADETLQWFIPFRVGEAHDIFLNAVAVACGLCFAVSIDPPSRLAVPFHRSQIRPIAYGVSAVVVAFALFFQAVHLGHRSFNPVVGMFWSTYDEAALKAAARDRAARWTVEPPVAVRRLSREDHYLAEGLWHVQERNRAWGAGDPFTAWRENMLLETYFAPVLDTPSYASAVAPRWSPEQRAAVALNVGPDPGFYMSRAAPYPIYTWPPLAFWIAVAAIVAAILTAC